MFSGIFNVKSNGFVVHAIGQCFLNLFLHYILLIFQVVEIIGGGGGKTICLPPNIFIGGRLPPPPPPPRIDASGAEAYTLNCGRGPGPA